MSRKESVFRKTERTYALTRGKLKFISGKWFYKDTEIKHIHKYLYKMGIFESPNELQQVIDSYIILYGNSGKWPPPEIIAEAAKIKELKPLCYPLTEKQLIIINYLLRHDEEIFFILTGVGGSGKSTFANIIVQIFDNDTAALTLSDLGNDFKLATGINKRLIYSTEINSDDINNGALKQLTSNEEITVNGKFEKPYKATCQSAFFFHCNVNPRLDLSDTGMLRRILYYSMNEKIKNPDPALKSMEWTREDIVNIVAHAMQVDMTDWQKKFEKETRYNLLKDNSVYRFRSMANYKDYEAACIDERLRPFSKPRWEDIKKLIKEWGDVEPNILLEVEQEEGLPF